MKQILLKMEHWCAYQERCHKETEEKLRSFRLDEEEAGEIIAALIAGNFLNEERFARSFARGKHRIKGWGRIRIVNELKFRHISPYNIKAGLSEIDEEEYEETFDKLARTIWESTFEKDKLKKRKKCCDFLLRKGYESEVVYRKITALENLNKP